MTKTQAIAYLRVSGKGQADGDKGGFDRQAETIRQYAKRNRMEVVETYQDAGVSGKAELADREGLAALLDRLESNGVGIVLVERADRLARDLITSEVILRQFRDIGVKVIAADGGTDLTEGDSTDPTAKLIRQVLAAVSEFEKDVIVMKLRAARQRRRRQGHRVEGRKPFGHYPGERETLDRIFELHRKPRGKPRRSFHKIAKMLNAEGRSTRSGKPWNRVTVQRIIERGRPEKPSRASRGSTAEAAH